ncbi:unnamed protein product [Choristocarpus tenellus]
MTMDKTLAGRWALRLGLDDTDFQHVMDLAETEEAKVAGNTGSTAKSGAVGGVGKTRTCVVEGRAFNGVDGERKRNHLDCEVLVLPLSHDRVVDVTDLRGLSLARSILLGSPEGPVPVVGLDMEWRPYAKHNSKMRSSRSQKTKVSLLQVACLTHVFLFDLMTLEEGWDSSSDTLSLHIPLRGEAVENEGSRGGLVTENAVEEVPVSLEGGAQSSTAGMDSSTREATSAAVRELVRDLLGSPQVIKVAYGFEGDLRRLEESYPSTGEARVYTHSAISGKVIDLAEVNNFSEVGMFSEILEARSGTQTTLEESTRARTGRAGRLQKRGQTRGLASVVQETLGVHLDKAMQTSNWEQRPLSKEQRLYAALDAYCLLLIVGTHHVCI